VRTRDAAQKLAIASCCLFFLSLALPSVTGASAYDQMIIEGWTYRTPPY